MPRIKNQTPRKIRVDNDFISSVLTAVFCLEIQNVSSNAQIIILGFMFEADPLFQQFYENLVCRNFIPQDPRQLQTRQMISFFYDAFSLCTRHTKNEEINQSLDELVKQNSSSILNLIQTKQEKQKTDSLACIILETTAYLQKKNIDEKKITDLIRKHETTITTVNYQDKEKMILKGLVERTIDRRSLPCIKNIRSTLIAITLFFAAYVGAIAYVAFLAYRRNKMLLLYACGFFAFLGASLAIGCLLGSRKELFLWFYQLNDKSYHIKNAENILTTTLLPQKDDIETGDTYYTSNKSPFFENREREGCSFDGEEYKGPA